MEKPGGDSNGLIRYQKLIIVTGYPRGSAYARNGSVISISIDGNKIKAKVKGNQPKPYDITIVIPPFFESEIKKLIKSVAEKPVIISKLLNRELDPELLQIAAYKGLKLFPQKWTDFKMQCSCPNHKGMLTKENISPSSNNGWW